MKRHSEELTKVRMLIERLNIEYQQGAIVIVEGKRDKEVLIKLGYKGKIITINDFRGLYKLVEYVERSSKVILLLDMDRKGRYLTSKISKIINNVDLFYKKELINITKGRIKRIEELIIYVQDNFIY